MLTSNCSSGNSSSTTSHNIDDTKIAYTCGAPTSECAVISILPTVTNLYNYPKK